jgi:UDPglucose 6-dehydrogenase
VKLGAVLLSKGASLVGHDPEAGESFLRAMADAPAGRVKVVQKQYDALDGADALVVLTEWRSYRAPAFAEVKKRLRPAKGGAPLVLDARNIWRPTEVTAAGLHYQGIGVPPVATGR